jgi:O-antigen ligase
MKFWALSNLVLAFALSELLIGGARLLFSLPAYGLLALAGLCAIVPQWRRAASIPLGAVITTFLFLGYVLLRNRASPFDYLARPDFFLVLGALIVYLLTVVFFVRWEERRTLFYALLALAVGQAVLGAIQFREGNQYMPFWWMQRPDQSWRASGFYISPNHFAGLLEIIALLALSMTVWSKRSVRQKVLIGYVGACCIVGVAISGSRGGYLALLGGCGCLLFLSVWVSRVLYPRQWTYLAAGAVTMVVVGIGAVGTVMFQSEALKQRFASINDPENMRFLLWNAALEQYKLSPVWGTGSGTYLHYGRIFRDPRVQNDPVFVHNDYLHLLAEYGLLGAAGFLIFFLWHVGSGLRTTGKLAWKTSELRETRSDELALHLGALSAMAAYVVHSAVDFNLHLPGNALVMAMIFGIVANPGFGRPDISWQERTAAGILRGTLAGLAVIVLAYGIPKLPGEWYAEQARQALKNYRLPEARALAEKALRHEAANPDVYYYAGEALREMAAQAQATATGDPEQLGAEAVRMFQRGLEVYPYDSRTLLSLAHAYDGLKQYGKAEETLNRAAAIDPHSAYIHAYRALHYLAQGKIKEAGAELEIASQMDFSKENKLINAGLEELRRLLGPAAWEHPPLIDILEDGTIREIPYQ